MASIPEYQRKVGSRPINQQQISVSTNADTFGAGIGRAAQQVGQGVFKAADALDFKNQLTADAEAREAFNGYRTAQQDFLMNPETGVLNQTGSNALEGQEQVDNGLKGLRNRYGEGLNGRARKAYDARVDDMEYQADQRVLSHTSRESRNYITNQRKSSVEGYVEEAVTNWSDEELYSRNLGQALQEQGELARLEGWDEATTRNAAEALISSTTRGRIVQAGTEDPLLAEEMLENSREILSAEDEHALDTGMKPMIQAAKVNRMIQPFIKSGAQAGSDPYLAMVTKAESSNNPRAANNRANPGVAAADGSTSSALGPHQFLRGTYLEEVRKLRARGGARWADGMSDAQIAATRTNVALENEVFESFRAENQQQIAAAGFPVTPLTEYAYHHFGDGGGLGLLRAARDNPGAPITAAFGVSTPGILKSNPQLKGKTAGEALDWLANHLGVDDVTAAGGSFFDAQGAMVEAMKIEDPELQAAALSKISSLMVLQDKSRAADRQSAQEQAWENYVQTGVDTVPMDLKLRMGQGGWTAYQSAVENDMKGIDITNEETWETLTRAASNPKEFVEMNLMAHKSNLSDADYRGFVVMQEAAKAKISGDALKESDERNGMNFGQMFTAADDIYRAVVDDTANAKMSQEQRQQRVEFERNLMRMAQDFFDKEKREPNTQEVRNMATTLAMPVTYYAAPNLMNRLWFGDDARPAGEGFFFDVDNRPTGTQYDITVEYDDIPHEARTEITREIMATNGAQLPSPKEIADAYEQRRLMSAGLPPNVNIGNVPPWLIEVERGDNPDITDEELVEAYQLFLMDQ